MWLREAFREDLPSLRNILPLYEIWKAQVQVLNQEKQRST